MAHRDEMVLRWICEQYAARLDHLEHLSGNAVGAVRIMVRKMRELGYVQTRQVIVGERTWVIPTAAGLRACGLHYGAMLPSTVALAHIGAINDVRLHIQSRSPLTEWVCERDLKAGHQPGGDVPDGLAINEGRTAAIEVELHTKQRSILYMKLDRVEPRFDAIVYFCSPLAHPQLTKAAATGRWPKLVVRELPQPRRRPRRPKDAQ